MPQGAARLALEFEVLTTRAARQGLLPLDDLTDTYGALVSDARPELVDPRRVDLAGLTQALSALPPGLSTCRRLLLVPDLSLYTYTPIGTTILRCGRLADGTVLGEAPPGPRALYAWVASLCLVAHELRKAARLLTPGSSPSLAELAFALGHDEITLNRAISETDGELLNLLLTGQLPAVHIHASLDPDVLERQAWRQGQQVVTALAESGLIDRPLHLWVGDPLLTDCLSPYCRELRQVLLRWARAHPEALGPDLLPVPGGEPSEDVIYAILNDFLMVDSRLYSEKIVAERTVGIIRHAFRDGDPGGFELIDLGRVDPMLCDPRLPPWRLRQPAPAVIRISADSTASAQIVRALTEGMGGRLASITVVNQGVVLGAAPGALMLPRLLIRWGGGDKLPVPLTAGLGVNDFLGLTDRPVQSGTVITVPSLLLASASELARQYQSFAPGCMTVGDSAILEILHEGLWAGALTDQVEINWLVVGTETTEAGRPSVATLRALAAAAVARLRRALAPQAPPVPPPQPQAPTTHPTSPTTPITGMEPRRSTAWALRIKA